MSSYVVIQKTPDIESILTNMIRFYLKEKVDFQEMFPNQGDVKVVTDHPFAKLIHEQSTSQDGGTTRTGTASMFPCVVVTAGSVQKNPPNLLQGGVQWYTLKRAILNDIDAMGANHFVISQEAITQLTGLFDASPTDEVHAEGIVLPKRANVSIEIWAENHVVRNRLYDLVEAFLGGYARQDLDANHFVTLFDDSIAGEKGGLYNWEFGVFLHGGTLRLHCDYQSMVYTINTVTEIAGVEVDIGYIEE